MKTTTRGLAGPVVAFLGLAVTPLAAQQPGAPEFVARECGCAALFPATPEERRQTTDTQVGSIEFVFYILDQGTSAFMMGFNDYPAQAASQADPEAVLDGARDGAVQNVNGTLVHEEHIRLGPYPGRELRVSIPGGKILYSRVVFAAPRLYQVLAMADDGGPEEAGANSFIQSFHLTAR